MQTGMVFAFIAGSTNTGATTLNINSVGAKAVMKATGGGGVERRKSKIGLHLFRPVQYQPQRGGAGAWLLVNRP